MVNNHFTRLSLLLHVLLHSLNRQTHFSDLVVLVLQLKLGFPQLSDQSVVSILLSMLVECRELSVQEGLLDGLISSLTSFFQLLC